MAEQMKDEDRLKIYMAMAETSRKWVAVMDAKAGFLSALNAALLGFIWAGAKLVEAGDLTRGFTLAASVFAFISLFSALWVVLPRGSLVKIFGKHSRYTTTFKAISFYGYIASKYPKGHEAEFTRDVLDMDAAALCHETLEQHFTISHSVELKSKWVSRAGIYFMVALAFSAAGLATKFAYDSHAQNAAACVEKIDKK